MWFIDTVFTAIYVMMDIVFTTIYIAIDIVFTVIYGYSFHSNIYSDGYSFYSNIYGLLMIGHLHTVLMAMFSKTAYSNGYSYLAYLQSKFRGFSEVTSVTGVSDVILHNMFFFQCLPNSYKSPVYKHL
jgi:hypothetical protein